MRKTLGVGVLIASVLIWIPASDVIRLVANLRPVLLGRYSVNHLALLLSLTPILWTCGGILLSRVRLDRNFALQAAMVTVSTVVGVTLAAVLSRIIVPARYEVSHVYHDTRVREQGDRAAGLQGFVQRRAPNLRIDIAYDDQPPPGRSFDGNHPGYPRVEGTLSTDSAGFRNRERRGHYDVVVSGDSFTEGNRVSDEDAWPVVLSRTSGLTVYNLGIGGLSPREYLNNFATFGLPLQPKTFIVMFYEGNDFKVPKLEQRPFRFRDIYAETPLESAMQTVMIGAFGPLLAGLPLPPSKALSWMPVEVRAGGVARYYSFRPAKLADLLWSREKFLRSKGWSSTTKLLLEMKSTAQAHGVRFILGFAPQTSHLVMPLVRGRVSDEQIRAFLELAGGDLATEQGFNGDVFSLLDTKEAMLKEFCRSAGIEFVSLTGVLRAYTARGEQVYYSYDSHWTPLGQKVAGETLAAYLRSHPTLARR